MGAIWPKRVLYGMKFEIKVHLVLVLSTIDVKTMDQYGAKYVSIMSSKSRTSTAKMRQKYCVRAMSKF